MNQITRWLRNEITGVPRRRNSLACLVAGIALLMTLSQSAVAGLPNHPRWNAALAADGVHPMAPPLLNLRAKLTDPNWLVAWLLHPGKIRGHRFMRRLNLQVDEAQILAGYLYRGPRSQQTTAAWKGGDARVGATLFVQRGCRGCHTIDAQESRSPTRAPDLTGIGIKVRPEWLFEWLKAPRSYDPNTAMPQLALSDDDIRHLIAFLMSHREGAEVVAAAPRARADGPVDVARVLVERFYCFRCHLMEEAQVVLPPTGWEVEPPGCTSCHQPAHGALWSSPDAATPDPGNAEERTMRTGQRLVTYYNCRGCHQIEGVGGQLAGHLERKTWAPPQLDGEGARVQPTWLVDFLQHPTAVRPWLPLRMPAFGMSPAEATALAQYFAALAHVPPTDEALEPAPVDLAEVGARRLAHFKCAQCHPSNLAAGLPKDVDPDDLSVDLRLVKTRLRPSWIRDFLARPKAVVGAHTRMPAVFYNTDGVPQVDEPDRDIRAISAYLFQMTELPPVTPSPLRNGTPPTDWSTTDY